MITLKDIQKNDTLSYQEYEERGRLLFKGWTMGRDDVIFNRCSTNEMSHWDVSYYSGGTAIVGEIKLRQCTSTKYDTLILQVNKLKELQAIQDNIPHSRIHYINIFNDGEMIIFDLTDLDPLTVDVLSVQLPKTTSGSKELTNKQIIYLPINGRIYPRPIH